jgi:hypothetical protein
VRSAGVTICRARESVRGRVSSHGRGGFGWVSPRNFWRESKRLATVNRSRNDGCHNSVLSGFADVAATSGAPPPHNGNSPHPEHLAAVLRDGLSLATCARCPRSHRNPRIREDGVRRSGGPINARKGERPVPSRPKAAKLWPSGQFGAIEPKDPRPRISKPRLAGGRRMTRGGRVSVRRNSRLVAAS